MRKHTYALRTTDAQNNDLGYPFRTDVPPICCHHDVFSWPGARNLPVVAQGVTCMEFGLNAGAILVTSGTYANQIMTKCQSIQDGFHRV